MRSRLSRLCCALVLPLLLVGGAAQAQSHVTSPKEQFGHNIGDDYWLPNYDQYVTYLTKIAHESNRAKLIDIGKTAEGRTQYTLIVSAPENMKNLEHYRQISERLARARDLTDAQARQLANEGKAVVWIDGGLHATEVLGASQLIETEYDFLSRTDPETTRILHDVIILFTNINPDGMQLVANWYMQEPDSLKRNMNIPRLYEKYAGHDDNRDFFMANLPETQNDERVMFREWYPQILYNHHQTGPAGTVMFSPPFRDPFDYNLDPMIVTGMDMLGAAIHARLDHGAQARVHDAIGLELFHLVERRHAHRAVLPQHVRPAHRDDRQPDAGAHSLRAGQLAAAQRRPVSDHAAGVALPPVGGLLGERQLRRARSGVAPPRPVPLRHL